MYKINLHYQSETRGVYSSEEIVTLNSSDFQKEWMKLLRKWTKLLIPELSYNQIKRKPEDVLQALIHSKLDQLNKDYPGEVPRMFLMSVHITSQCEKHESYHPRSNIYEVIYNSDVEDNNDEL